MSSKVTNLLNEGKRDGEGLKGLSKEAPVVDECQDDDSHAGGEPKHEPIKADLSGDSDHSVLKFAQIDRITESSDPSLHG